MDIVDQAEKVMKELKKDERNMVTTSQIRKFLTAVNILNEKVNVYRIKNPKSDKLLSELALEIKFLKVKLAYQIGRAPERRGQNSVQTFVEKAELISKIDEIGDSIPKYEEFAHYIEALVAYHKFYGGKD